MRKQPNSAFTAPENTGHPTRDHIGATVVDLSKARAKRDLANLNAVEDWLAAADDAAFEADLALEQKLGRERLSPEALGELRRDLIHAMTADGAELSARATVLHSVLYAMNRVERLI